MAKKPYTNGRTTVESIKHKDKRKNIPTAEFQAVVRPDEQKPIELRYARNTDLDPQLVWRGKDQQNWSDLVVHAPPLYIQEKVHPKVLIDDLVRQTNAERSLAIGTQTDLFAEFNGLPKDAEKTDFYQHDQNWSNRMILGDSLQVMASLTEREGLRGKVQCIYFDPPYGIKFNSNFQWSTTSRDVKDGHAGHITREPEQVKAFRDTWKDGVHSYLTYLRDRLTVARDLLSESGSIFVQIGDENVHRVRALLDEVFGDACCVSSIVFAKTSGSTGDFLGPTFDTILWYAKSRDAAKFRRLLLKKAPGKKGGTGYKQVQLADLSRRPLSREEIDDPETLPEGARIYFRGDLTSQGIGREKGEGAASWFAVDYEGRSIKPKLSVRWKTNEVGFARLIKAYRVALSSDGNLGYVRFLDDFPAYELADIWGDTVGQNQFGGPKTYVVQTALTAVERCILMATDPGDLVLDPTCGSGTTAYVAEQWGRRWITIDTSRVALALTRARIMGAKYPFYLLSDSREGQLKEAEISRTTPSSQPTHGDMRHGFVYERVPHITLKSIAHNAEIDVLWENHQAVLESLRANLNAALKKKWQEWEIPRGVEPSWSDAVKKLHADWWQARIDRQKEIDASIAAKAEFEYLYDKPYEDKRKLRVAGPFTVESLSPHRMLSMGEDDQLIDPMKVKEPDGPPYGAKPSFPDMIIENLRVAGVQQAHKEDRIVFTSLVRWPGGLVCADGKYLEGDSERRAAIFIGPEFGTVQRVDLVAAAREAAEAGFDVLVACAFNYEARTTEFAKLGKLPVLKARMNADLHMAGELKTTGKGNLFVVFGEPDITLLTEKDGRFRVKVNGVDVFKPQTGEVISSNADGIACWLIDTDYNEESFFVRHAYFLGANDPYNALKKTLKVEIDEEAWASLHSDTSRPFQRPAKRRIAVKVINHLGDEVMKVFKV
ncbi:DNA methyltransferase [Sorangium sp. So ce1151]|uniref:site-specific DNA-methyltransferase n=1 Tax=Sorangium sp. So ce1151 TaxID=3133332 RepID=UPI003F64330C